jgi:hypothetical protein
MQYRNAVLCEGKSSCVDLNKTLVAAWLYHVARYSSKLTKKEKRGVACVAAIVSIASMRYQFWPPDLFQSKGMTGSF